MQLNSFAPRHKRFKSTAVGRGGKRGKTSGRGGKGQTARAGHKIRPEMRDMIKKLPKLRGHGKNRSRTVRPQVRSVPINLEALNSKYVAGETVSPRTLQAKGLISFVSRRAPLVKILGTGEVKYALTISNCLISVSAKKAIEAAGGSLTHD